jgi:hypothetical protein
VEGGEKWWARLGGGLKDRRNFLGGYTSSKLVRAPLDIVLSYKVWFACSPVKALGEGFFFSSMWQLRGLLLRVSQ